MEDFSLLKEKILRLRNCGRIHCALDIRTNNDWQKTLMEFGKKMSFSINIEEMRNINREQALDILKSVLKQDLAYLSQIMSDEQAAKLAKSFCDNFQNGAIYLTNGSFEENPSGKSSLGSWYPVTEATFDTGVIIIDGNSVGCVWVEDED